MERRVTANRTRVYPDGGARDIHQCKTKTQKETRGPHAAHTPQATGGRARRHQPGASPLPTALLPKQAPGARPHARSHSPLWRRDGGGPCAQNNPKRRGAPRRCICAACCALRAPRDRPPSSEDTVLALRRQSDACEVRAPWRRRQRQAEAEVDAAAPPARLLLLLEQGRGAKGRGGRACAQLCPSFASTRRLQSRQRPMTSLQRSSL